MGSRSLQRKVPSEGLLKNLPECGCLMFNLSGLLRAMFAKHKNSYNCLIWSIYRRRHDFGGREEISPETKMEPEATVSMQDPGDLQTL